MYPRLTTTPTTPTLRASPPPTSDVREWIKVPATVLSDDQLAQVVDAEALLQARLCTTGETLSSDLVQAIYRRVARTVAARGIPLGMLGGDSEFGTARLSRFDAEIERLEGPNRKLVFG